MMVARNVRRGYMVPFDGPGRQAGRPLLAPGGRTSRCRGMRPRIFEIAAVAQW